MQGLLKYRVCSIYFIMSLFLDTIEVPFIFVHKGVVFWNVQKKQKCGILTSEIIFDSTNKNTTRGYEGNMKNMSSMEMELK